MNISILNLDNFIWKNVTAALWLSLYVTDLSAATEALSSHITNKRMASSCTLIGEPSPLTAYVAKTSSTRSTEDQRRRHVDGESAWRQEVMLSSKDYGKVRLTPSTASDLEMLMWICTIVSQWISSWIIGRRKKRIITVNIAMSNGIIFSICTLSVLRAR